MVFQGFPKPSSNFCTNVPFYVPFHKYRWVMPGGERYCTNREDENPNRFLQRTDYPRTPVRKRKNE